MSPIPLYRRRPHPHLDELPPCRDYLPDYEIHRLDRAVHNMTDLVPPPWVAYAGIVLWTIATAIVAFMAGAAWVQP